MKVDRNVHRQGTGLNVSKTVDVASHPRFNRRKDGKSNSPENEYNESLVPQTLASSHGSRTLVSRGMSVRAGQMQYPSAHTIHQSNPNSSNAPKRLIPGVQPQLGFGNMPSITKRPKSSAA